MADQLPLLRQWVLLRILCTRHYGVTIKDMVHELNVSEKTIRRDLETFQRVGFPLEEVVGDFGRKTWHMEDGKAEPGLNFAYDEAIALYLGRRFLEPLAGTVFWEAAQRAFKKIRATLGADALKYIDQFGTIFHQTMVGAGDYTKKAELIDELMVGIEDRKAVFITYQSLRATEPVTYDIYPYGLIYHRGALYLVGRSPHREEICHWKVSRIEAAEVTQVHFQRPEDFDLEQHLAKSFGVYHGDGDVKIKVRFAPAVARYVSESNWHESQKLAPQKDGGVGGRVRFVGHRGDQTLDHELRPARRRAGTGVVEGGDRSGIELAPGGVLPGAGKDPSPATECRIVIRFPAPEMAVQPPREAAVVGPAPRLRGYPESRETSGRGGRVWSSATKTRQFPAFCGGSSLHSTTPYGFSDSL